MKTHTKLRENRERRQYDLIIQIIESFENSETEIDDLITKLEGLVNAIDDDDDVWKANFHENWADLEVARAIALSEERTMLNEHETKIVFDAVSRLKKLVLEKIEVQA